MARRVTRTTDPRVLGALEMESEDFARSLGDGLEGAGLASQVIDKFTAPAQAEDSTAIRQRQLEAFRAATHYEPRNDDEREMGAGR
ncbi:hypothetical protein [Saccharopolyspora hattusasensis]|uniref:hypothetical protein n=1 Tax=Saccharopolyspora hattusasensis TaxID=1128679 RepID=UPI003D955C15